MWLREEEKSMQPMYIFWAIMLEHSQQTKESGHLLEEIEKIEWEKDYQPLKKATTYTKLGKQKTTQMQKGLPYSSMQKSKIAFQTQKFLSCKIGFELPRSRYCRHNNVICTNIILIRRENWDLLCSHRKGKYKILIGDFNAKIGIKEKEEKYQTLLGSEMTEERD